MTVSKSWAYTSEFGSETISAWAITQERAKHGGKPLDVLYWSSHQSGLRKRVKQVQRNGGKTTFFAYSVAGEGGGGEGESLSHKLLKQAIAQMTGTTFRLDELGDHKIQVTWGETEKRIADTMYRADAYLRFTSTSSLGLRWSGEVYIEVRHTHAVPVPKEEALRRLQAPVVEVPLHPIFLYLCEEDKTSDPLEAAHVARLCNLLQKGFLRGKVISDRRSSEFLEAENRQLFKQHQLAVKRLESALSAQGALTRQLDDAAAKHKEDSARQQGAHAQRISQLEMSHDAEKKRADGLSRKLQQAIATIAEERQTQHRKKTHWAAAGLMAVSAAVSFTWLLADRASRGDVPADPQDLPVASTATPALPSASVGSTKRSHRASRRRQKTPAQPMPAQATDQQDVDERNAQ